MKVSENVRKFISKKKKACVITGVFVLALAGGVCFFRVKAKEKQTNSVTIESATAETGNISTSVTGTGNLETAETVDVTVPSGIEIDEVKVESGDKVTKGQTLATVKKASVASALSEVEESMETVTEELSDSSLSDLEKENLNEKYATLKSQKELLTTLHDSLTITATADGVVGNVNVSAGSETSGSTSGTSSGSSTNTNTNSNANTNSSTSGSSSVTKTSSMGSSNGLLLLTTTTETENAENTVATLSAKALETISDYSNLVIPSPVTGEKGITKIDADKTHDQGYEVTSITWDCNGKFQSDTAYTATIELKALEGYQFVSGNTPVLDCSAYKCEISGTGEGNRMTITAKYEKTASDSKTKSEEASKETTGKSSSEIKNAESSVTDGSGSDTVVTSGDSSDGTISAGSSGDATSSGSTGTSSSSGSSDLYNSSMATAFTILTEDSYKVSLSVDELDILSVKQGQTADITLDAIEGKTFEGTVTKVGTVGSTNGSSAKYTVEITVPKEENMLLGMSASATIQIDESEDAVLIPLSALQESGGKSFVYTEKKKDGTLSGKVEVETGLSNDSQVEITSGLSEGDTVYYQVVESNSSDKEMNMDFGGGMQPTDGAPSDMGEAPSGNGGGPSGDGQKPEN